jgi:type IV secretory pathway VirB2 component (pilin)
MTPARSLFDVPADRPVAAATSWMERALLGDAAVALCVIAVALLGLAMLNGQLPVRRAGQVVLGIFVLLGAPVIAGNFAGMWAGSNPRYEAPPAPAVTGVIYEREELPPADFDPYAGASLRRE